MNDIFDGSTDVAVDRLGRARAATGSASSSTTSSTTTAPTSSRPPTTGTSSGNEGASYGNPDFVGPVGRAVRRDGPELRALAELSGDRRGPERDRAPRRRQRDLPRHRTCHSRPTARSPATRTNPATLLPEQRGARASPTSFGEFGEFFFSRILLRVCTTRGRSSPCRARATSPSPTSGSRSSRAPRRLLGPVVERRHLQLPALHRRPRHPGLHPRPRPRGPRASATAATRSSTSVPISTSTCIRPRSPR